MDNDKTVYDSINCNVVAWQSSGTVTLSIKNRGWSISADKALGGYEITEICLEFYDSTRIGTEGNLLDHDGFFTDCVEVQGFEARETALGQDITKALMVCQEVIDSWK